VRQEAKQITKTIVKNKCRAQIVALKALGIYFMCKIKTTCEQRIFIHLPSMQIGEVVHNNKMAIDLIMRIIIYFIKIFMA
jgi:hypothetical protein